MNLAIKTDLLPALVSQAVLYKNSWKKSYSVFPRGFPTPNKRPLIQLAEGILTSCIIAPGLGWTQRPIPLLPSNWSRRHQTGIESGYCLPPGKGLGPQPPASTWRIDFQFWMSARRHSEVTHTFLDKPWTPLSFGRWTVLPGIGTPRHHNWVIS